MPPTIFSQNIQEIKKFFKTHKKIILKPINSFSGNNIHLLNKFNRKFINQYIKKHNYIICQNFYLKLAMEIKEYF